MEKKYPPQTNVVWFFNISFPSPFERWAVGWGGVGIGLDLQPICGLFDSDDGMRSSGLRGK